MSRVQDWETGRLSRPARVRILVIEDEPFTCEAIARSLQQENYEVLTASDGTTGLELLLQLGQPAPQRQAIDLLILDLGLPDFDGLDLCRRLRASGYNLPILMISGKASETDRVAGLDLGGDDYLVKPFGMRELIARCRALLRSWERQSRPSILRVGDIVLNLQTSILFVRGREVYLSPREFQLLEFFMKHPHQVWSREQLVNQVWGRQFIGNYKTLDVHIRWLRQKLETNPSQPEYLVTLRRLGYRFG